MGVASRLFAELDDRLDQPVVLTAEMEDAAMRDARAQHTKDSAAKLRADYTGTFFPETGDQPS